MFFEGLLKVCPAGIFLSVRPLRGSLYQRTDENQIFFNFTHNTPFQFKKNPVKGFVFYRESAYHYQIYGALAITQN
jgi:hypothetical protein